MALYGAVHGKGVRMRLFIHIHSGPVMDYDVDMGRMDVAVLVDEVRS